MQTYHKIWMHFVWTTNKRERIIVKTLMSELISHYKEYGKIKDIYVDTVNGGMEHLHLLVGLKPSQSASEVANLLKGESSNWINKNSFIQGKFAWQNGYSVFSVSESQVEKVRRYIFDQEEHHRRKTYQEEVTEFLNSHSLEIK